MQRAAAVLMLMVGLAFSIGAHAAAPVENAGGSLAARRVGLPPAAGTTNTSVAGCAYMPSHDWAPVLPMAGWVFDATSWGIELKAMSRSSPDRAG